MASNQQSLSVLAPDVPDVTIVNNGGRSSVFSNGNFLNLLLWFLIIAAITYFILITLKPNFVQNTDLTGATTGEVNQSKAITFSIIIALIIVIILYIMRASRF